MILVELHLDFEQLFRLEFVRFSENKQYHGIPDKFLHRLGVTDFLSDVFQKSVLANSTILRLPYGKISSSRILQGFFTFSSQGEHSLNHIYHHFFFLGSTISRS